MFFVVLAGKRHRARPFRRWRAALPNSQAAGKELSGEAVPLPFQCRIFGFEQREFTFAIIKHVCNKALLLEFGQWELKLRKRCIIDSDADTAITGYGDEVRPPSRSPEMVEIVWQQLSLVAGEDHIVWTDDDVAAKL